jgi:hypothetical protein
MERRVLLKVGEIIKLIETDGWWKCLTAGKCRPDADHRNPVTTYHLPGGQRDTVRVRRPGEVLWS